MKREAIILTFILIGFFNIGFCQQNQLRDGKLLRGEKWQKFVPTEKADFYVATNGNDSWSGTLEAPNSDKTDGPFASIERAQKDRKSVV